MNKDVLASYIFAAGCFIFFWLAVPQYDLILDIKAATTDRQQLLAERTALTQNVKQLASQYESRKTEIDKLMTFLPPKTNLDQILEAIQKTSSETGIQLRGITMSPNTGASQNPYGTTLVTMEAGGGYDTMINLMKQLEGSLQLYDSSEMSISRDQNAPLSANLFNIEIKVSTYNLLK